MILPSRASSTGSQTFISGSCSPSSTVPVVNARHRSANNAEGRLTISRLNAPDNNIPNVDGTVWLIAMIQEAQRLDMERLSCLIDVNPVAATGQHVNVPCGGDLFAIDLEVYIATAVRLLASYTIKMYRFRFVVLQGVAWNATE
jgi:hypothetical protein